MSTTTGGKIIRGALDKLGLRGAGQKVDGTVEIDMLGTLNTLIASLNLGPTFAWAQTETIIPLLAATKSLTIGPGQQIDIDRPDRIEDSCFVRVGTVDYPCRPVDRDTYNAIQLKTLGSAWPVVLFWDAGNPLGNIYLWPQGPAALHLVTSMQVSQFADVTTEYDLPNGYERLLIYTLAEESAPEFQVQVPASVARIAGAARRMVKRNNLDVPQMDIPRTLDEDSGRFASAEVIAGLWI